MPSVPSVPSVPKGMAAAAKEPTKHPIKQFPKAAQEQFFLAAARSERAALDAFAINIATASPSISTPSPTIVVTAAASSTSTSTLAVAAHTPPAPAQGAAQQPPEDIRRRLRPGQAASSKHRAAGAAALRLVQLLDAEGALARAVAEDLLQLRAVHRAVHQVACRGRRRGVAAVGVLFAVRTDGWVLLHDLVEVPQPNVWNVR